jgi:hypothetical protein
MLSKLLAIAGNTFLETIRQPLYGIVLILTAFMMVMNVSLAAFTLYDDNLFLRDLGLSTLLISGMFLAAFSASGVLNREIENKTVLTLISKPISRPVLVAGKFLGLISALTTAFYISTLVMLFVIRHKVLQNTTDPWDMPVILFGGGAVVLAVVVAGLGNYAYSWQFNSSAVLLVVPLLTAGYGLVSVIDRDWKLQVPHVGDAQLLAAVVLVLLMVWVITAVALTSSCKFGQIPTLVICFLALAIGLCSDYVFGKPQFEGHSLWAQPSWTGMLAWIAYRMVPNLGIFWVADAITAGKHVTPQYVLSACGYAAAFIVAILAIGLGIFQKREIG